MTSKSSLCYAINGDQITAIFCSQVYSLQFFLIFAHLWWFGVLGLGSYFGFLRLGFSVDGVWGLWCGAFWVFLVGALYININNNPGKKMVRD